MIQLAVFAIIVVVVVGLAAWVAKVRLKRGMENDTGRKVDDYELTSISGWMKVVPRNQESGYQQQRSCLSCGAQVGTDDPFCAKCGRAQAQPVEPIQPLVQVSAPLAKTTRGTQVEAAPQTPALTGFASHTLKRNDRHAVYSTLYATGAWLSLGLIPLYCLVMFLLGIRPAYFGLVLMGTVWLFISLRMKSKRYALNPEQAIKNDTRDPILYLRSFAHDDKKVSKPKLPNLQEIVQDQGLSYTKITELQLTSAFASIGPLVAVGESGEELAPLGGTRLYFRNKEWQEKVKELMSISRLIVIHPGNTAGVEWEMATARSMLAPGQLIFVFASWHSLKKYGRQIEYEIFADQLKTILGISLPDKFDGAYFLYFNDDWTPRLAYPSWYKRWVYKSRSKRALQTSLNHILRQT